MLAIDREQHPSSPRLSCERELTRSDETLLVRKRERDSALERPKRRRETGETHDCVQDDIRFGPLQKSREVASDLSMLHPTLRSERVELVRARSKSAGLQIGVSVDDLDCLAPDRPRRAEDGDPFHDQSVRAVSRLGFGTNVLPTGADFAVTIESGGGQRRPWSSGLLGGAEGGDDVVGGDPGEEQGVEPVQ